MPRAVDPHLNEQTLDFPTDCIEEFVLSTKTEKMLPSGLDVEERKTAKADLAHALGEYWWEITYGPNRYTRATAKASLYLFLKMEDYSGFAICTLNSRADFLLLYVFERGKKLDIEPYW